MSSIKVDFSGIDKLSKQLKKLEKVADKKTVTFGELFNEKFISSNTEFKTLDEFFSACNINTDEDFEAMPQEELDAFVRQHSKFSDFQDMVNTAGSEEISRRITKALK